MPKTYNNFKTKKIYEAPKQMLNTIDEKDKINKIKNKEKIVLLTVSVPEKLLKKFEEEADTKLWKKSTLMKVILEKRYSKNDIESENE
ncbi:MAG: hypothetical protein H9Q65_03920 [Spiroplasma ixodetis]|nr:hypothetical protein [Spiroplasma ixodetis]MBP1527184.1 hypothetical protein [Spiroplasma ixodetis]MBP1528382.1 hypothetical protein [Spiroplasma ixodetis]